MSYESTKLSTNSGGGGGETMTSEMPSQSPANNFYPNNNNNTNANRAQAMIMNPMMGSPYYNGPPQGAATQQMPNRPMYQPYPPAAAPPAPPHHPQHHQIVSICFFVHIFSRLKKNELSERIAIETRFILFSYRRLTHTNHVQAVIIHRTHMILVFMNISNQQEEIITEIMPIIK